MYFLYTASSFSSSSEASFFLFCSSASFSLRIDSSLIISFLEMINESLSLIRQSFFSSPSGFFRFDSRSSFTCFSKFRSILTFLTTSCSMSMSSSFTICSFLLDAFNSESADRSFCRENTDIKNSLLSIPSNFSIFSVTAESEFAVGIPSASKYALGVLFFPLRDLTSS